MNLIPAIQLTANDANNLSWRLATCAFSDLRKPEQAVEWGKRAVKLRPNDGVIRNTLGAAYYRNGDWETAKSVLRQSMELRKGGDSYDWLFLAMSYWQTGDHDQAREWLAKSVKWTQENLPKDVELLRFQSEAQQLITAATETK